MKIPNQLKLEEKEKEFGNYTEAFLIDLHGVVYTFVNSDTNKPFALRDFTGKEELKEIPGTAFIDYCAYENCGMTTGAYLASQTYKYLVTGQQDALEKAERSFDGLWHIYEIGKEQEEGYFPKIYGNKCSEETSTDQYLYAMKGMLAYLPVAKNAHVSKIKRMIPRMADFWKNINYKRTYFSNKDMQWPLGRFPAFMLMAYQVSGEKKYMDEFIRLNEEMKLYLEPAENNIKKRIRKNSFSSYEKSKGNMFSMGAVVEIAAMEIMNLGECLNGSEKYGNYWLESMRQMWNEGKLGLAENGLAYRSFLYDPATEKVCIQELGFKEGKPYVHNGTTFYSWTGKILCPRSTMYARAGVEVNKYLPDEKPMATVVNILSEIKLEDMRQYLDPDGRQMLDEHRYWTKCVCADAIVNWLWAYWQAKYHGVLT